MKVNPITKRAGNSDPYMNITLGKFHFSDRKNAAEDVSETDIYKVLTIEAELPGASQLVIEMMSKNLIASDGLIGKTIIDLEDRWFDSRWQKLGFENRRGADAALDGSVRWDTKPIENRFLQVPSNTAPQGIFQCWLDILEPDCANIFLPDDVSLPPTQMFEVRVVIWKSKGTPIHSMSGLFDPYVRCWPEGCAAQDTDIHWRAKKGKASWNWRMKFDVELGHNSRAMKFPYLHVQMWDKDIIKWSDCLGEVHIDIGKYYRKAYKRNIALKLFETKQGAQAKRATEKKVEEDDGVESDDEDIPPEEEDEEEDEEDEEEEVEVDLKKDKPDAFTRDSAAKEGGHATDDAKSETADNIKLVKKAKKEKEKTSWIGRMFGYETAAEKKKRLAKEAADRRAKRQKEIEEARAKEEKDAAEREPLIKAEEDKKKKKEEDDDDVKGMISMIKNLTGLWEDDPDDSE